MAEQSDRPGLNEVKQQYKETKYVALKCFLCLFTSKSYPNIHGAMTNNSYTNLIRVIARVKQQLDEYNKKTNNSWKINMDSKQKCFLYRGIEYPENRMVMRCKIYWKSFVSTSKNKKIAQRFGPHKYTIQLNAKGHHPHIVVPKEFSEYDEEEVILFPYFYFEVKYVNKHEGGDQYIIQQIQKP